ncbi:MAG: GNAT family N-acetyltransferase [Planctomycetota bacterium]
MPSPTLTTPRLQLRPVTPADLDAMCAVFTDPVAMRYIGDGSVRTREQIAASLARSFDFSGPRPVAIWAVQRQDTGEVIGDALLVPIRRSGTAADDPEGRGPDIEVGYRLAQAHWGHGFATEAAGAVLAFAMDTLKLPRVIAVAYEANVASLRVLEKIGMRRVGLTDAYYDAELVLCETRTSEPRRTAR